jgi:GGDEF domain-containing protein
MSTTQRRKGLVAIACMAVGQVQFKRINDTFNHADGDDVLRAVTAAIARRCLRHCALKLASGSPRALH